MVLGLYQGFDHTKRPDHSWYDSIFPVVAVALDVCIEKTTSQPGLSPIKSKFYLKFDDIGYSITKPKVLWENSPESDNTVLVTFIPHGVEGAKYDATRFAYLDEAKAMIEKMKNNPNQFLLP